MRIGIDLGGTTIKGIRFTEAGEPEAEYTVPTPAKEGRGAIFSALFTTIDALWTDGVELIGVSSAGNIDPASGTCVYATDNLMGWTGANIVKELKERYHVRVLVDNDAVCALKGELKFHPDVKNVTMLTFGTGVGGASLVNGEILRGKRFDAARWGHVVLVPNGIPCNCGKRGCAEGYLSATALIRQAQAKLSGISNAKQIFERFLSGEGAAREVLEEFGFYLNVLLDNIRTALAPELIILGGGVAQSEEIVRGLLSRGDDIAFARLGTLAGAYGAVRE